MGVTDHTAGAISKAATPKTASGFTMPLKTPESSHLAYKSTAAEVIANALTSGISQ
jgi:hypothetical protein